MAEMSAFGNSVRCTSFTVASKAVPRRAAGPVGRRVRTRRSGNRSTRSFGGICSGGATGASSGSSTTASGSTKTEVLFTQPRAGNGEQARPVRPPVGRESQDRDGHGRIVLDGQSGLGAHLQPCVGNLGAVGTQPDPYQGKVPPVPQAVGQQVHQCRRAVPRPRRHHAAAAPVRHASPMPSVRTRKTFLRHCPGPSADREPSRSAGRCHPLSPCASPTTMDNALPRSMSVCHLPGSPVWSDPLSGRGDCSLRAQDRPVHDHLNGPLG